MKAYIDLLCEAIGNELNVGTGFNLIKFENFINPKIYLNICDYFNSQLKSKDVRLIAKLSKEKYGLWNSNNNYTKYLEEMDAKDYIEKDGNLTKWRNCSFDMRDKNTVVFLMGTELVEDKGGLDEFYNISPETLENYIGKQYSILLTKLNFNYNEDEYKIFNNLIDSIFTYTTKDILVLSSLLDQVDLTTSFNTLVKDILTNLYKNWDLPNIMRFNNNDLLKNNIKEKIGKAYKFSRRIGVEYQSEKKIKQVKKKIEDYYSKFESDINNEFSERFPNYNNFDDFKEDLLNYVKGIEIDKVKIRLFEADFTIIMEILNMKAITGVITRTPKNPVMKGDPFKSLFLPIIVEYNDLETEKKEVLRSIDLNIVQIKLSGTKGKDSDELKDKWYKMCLFLGGIEKSINDLYLTNNADEEIEINIFSRIDNNEKNNIYPFSSKAIEGLAKNSILISSANTETKSKIMIEYTYKDDQGNEIYSIEYEWHIYDNDIWLNIFNVVNSSKFLALINQERALPIGISGSIDEMIDSLSESELFLLVNDRSIDYENIYDKFKVGDVEAIISNNLAAQFSICFNEILSNGFFNVYKNKENKLIKLLDEYHKFNVKLKEKIQKKEITNESAALLSKCFMWVNNNDYKSKSIIGVIIPPYHPIMLERMLERYRYLGNGFKEIFEQLKQPKEIAKIRIVKRFDRFDQLSTVTNSVEILIGKNNNFIGDKKTLGYYTIFGEINENYYITSSVRSNFVDNDSSVDRELTEATPVSKHISKTITDYIRTYPAKLDGVTIAFYEPNGYKEIIIGLNEVIKAFKEFDRIKIKLIVYTSDYRCKGATYFKYWIDNNFKEEDSVIIEPSIKYININDESLDTVEQYLEKQLDDCDLVFIEDIMDVKAIEPEDMNGDEQTIMLQNRYPTVYLPLACNQEKNRKLLVNQPQFMCSNSFSQLMVYVGSSIAKEDNYRIVKTVTLEEVTEKLIKVFSRKASWIVIMDENIDKKIIETTGNKIIAFSTGKGYFGELNSAISTKNNYFTDLRRFLGVRLRKKFNWKINEIEKAADVCINYAKEMDGAEIIKAINPSDEAINNYLAFLLTSKMLNIKTQDSDQYFIRKLISIDSHSHLFDEQINFAHSNSKETRPDFILLEIQKDNNNIESENHLKIKAKIIECKVAKQNERHVEKAKEQVVAGYTRLSDVWNSSGDSVQKRYWFNQLYRLLVYNNELNLNNEDVIRLNNKLSKINEGFFDITFDNEIYTYWLDVDINNYIEEVTENINGVTVKNIIVDKRAIKLLLTDETLELKQVKNDNILDEPEDTEKSDEVEAIKDNNVKDIKWPMLYIFKDYDNTSIENEEEEVRVKLARLKQEFELRKITIFPKGYVIGPDIIRVAIELGVGVDYAQLVKNITNIKIWLALNEEPLMFIEDGYVKLDIVRSNRKLVSFKEAIEKTINNDVILKDREDKLYVLLGIDVLGNPKVLDLSDSNNPHLLVAGQTGSGKSVLLASMLTSMMVYYTPQELEFLLVDPKRVELTAFKKSPFTKCTATEADDVIKILDDVTDEMYRRYSLFEDKEVQNISSYNKLVCVERRLKRTVLVIDEYGVLIESDKEFVKSFESAIKKLSQLSRAAGIHLIICTQSPKAEIITTTIRNNLPARVGLKVADSKASLLILDCSGAEKLLGKGDMLIKTADSANNIRCKSPFISQNEIRSLIDYYKTH